MRTKVLNGIVAAPEGLRRSDIEKLAGGPVVGDAIINELLKEKLIKRVGWARGTRYLAKEAAAPQRATPATRTEKKAVKKKALRARSDDRPPRRSAPPATPPNGNGTHFGINEDGELGIDAGEKKIVLDTEAFARLREFIERTKPVWDGASA